MKRTPTNHSRHGVIYFKRHYTIAELATFQLTLPKGYALDLVTIAYKERIITESKSISEDNDQSAADDYLDYLSSKW